MLFQTGIVSHEGGRRVNEDFADFYMERGGGCWVVADGLGGHQAGDIASKIAVQTFLFHYEQTKGVAPHVLAAGMEKAQQAILTEQKNNRMLSSMRTTMVALVCSEKTANWAHIGDSRLYHFRRGKIAVRTKDHSVCQALVNAGELTMEQIRFHEDRNRLYRVLGTDGSVKAAVNKGVQLQHGDAFLLCTDGFWEYVMEEEMENALMAAHSPDHWLNSMLAILEKRVQGNQDNFTALAVFVKK
ncbi:PP2C family protein-serine/threonine phosphatase [Priestia abyssalis]|uniref:PP2C family protein-serine/threonine phosphatase n=1 Tax=Priestia abyssalis TaxID=1221450 RepID=UPI000995D150|nr:protein phosphatase 2C domain-containing protein [Priestia abyssalis]